MTLTAHTTFSDLGSLAFDSPDQSVRYGEDKHQFIEGWSTTNASADSLLMIHGGCWLSDYDLTHVRPMCTAIRSMGLNVWSLEYRRVGDPGGGWPGTFEDVIAGIRATVAATGPGGGKFIIAGHSAGGHLALWASTRLSAAHMARRDLAVNINRTIGLAAISDLVTYAGGESPCERATVSLLGGPPEQLPQRYQEASPLLLPVNPGTVLVHGTDDQIVSIGQSRTFAQKTGAQAIEIEKVGHFDLINPNSIAFPYLSDLLVTP